MRISEYVDNLRKDKSVMAIRVEQGDIIEDRSTWDPKTGERKPDFVQIAVVKYAKVNPSGKVKLFQRRLFVRNLGEPLFALDYLMKGPSKPLVMEASLFDLIVKDIMAAREEGISISDIFSRSLAFLREYYDQMAIWEILTKGPAKSLMDNAFLIDHLVRSVGISKLEALSLYDIFARLSSFLRVLPEAMIFSEITTFLKPGLFLYDSLKVDALFTFLYHKRVSDAITAMDALRFKPQKYVSDTLALLDEMKRIGQFKLAIMDYIGLKPYDLVYLPELGIWVLIVEKREGGLGVVIA